MKSARQREAKGVKLVINKSGFILDPLIQYGKSQYYIQENWVLAIFS